MNVPNLLNYRKNFVKRGVVLPLKTIIAKSDGVLDYLPSYPKKNTGWAWRDQTDPYIYANAKWPKLTIVMPSYNQAKFIEEAIRSVLNQNYPNLEFIIIDGGSNDGTVEILKTYSPWISYWQSEKDKGQGHAINLGFSLASGDYYGWINSDDYYNKDAFFRLGQAIIKNRSEFYYGNSDEILEDGSYYKFWEANHVRNRFLRYGGLVASHATFWAKTIHVPILEEIQCAIDYELWLRLAKNVRRKYVNSTLGTVRHQAMAKSQCNSFNMKWKLDKELINDIHKLKDNFVITRLRIYEFKYYQYLYKLFTKDWL